METATGFLLALLVGLASGGETPKAPSECFEQTGTYLTYSRFGIENPEICNTFPKGGKRFCEKSGNSEHPDCI